MHEIIHNNELVFSSSKVYLYSGDKTINPVDLDQLLDIDYSNDLLELSFSQLTDSYTCTLDNKSYFYILIMSMNQESSKRYLYGYYELESAIHENGTTLYINFNLESAAVDIRYANNLTNVGDNQVVSTSYVDHSVQEINLDYKESTKQVKETTLAKNIAIKDAIIGQTLGGITIEGNFKKSSDKILTVDPVIDVSSKNIIQYTEFTNSSASGITWSSRTDGGIEVTGILLSSINIPLSKFIVNPYFSTERFVFSCAGLDSHSSIKLLYDGHELVYTNTSPELSISGLRGNELSIVLSFTKSESEDPPSINLVIYPQLENGEVRTSYAIPYVRRTSIILPESHDFLGKIGDFTDIIKIDESGLVKITSRIKKIASLKGTAGWVSKTLSGKQVYDLKLLGYPKPKGLEYQLSSRFSISDTLSSSSIQVFNTADGSVYLRIGSSVKSYIESNDDLVIYYVTTEEFDYDGISIDPIKLISSEAHIYLDLTRTLIEIPENSNGNSQLSVRYSSGELDSIYSGHTKSEINNLIGYRDLSAFNGGNLTTNDSEDPNDLVFNKVRGIVYRGNTSMCYLQYLKFYFNLQEILNLFFSSSSKYFVAEAALGASTILENYVYLGSNNIDGMIIYGIIPISISGDKVNDFVLVYSGASTCAKVLLYRITGLELSLSDFRKVQRPMLLAYINYLYLNVGDKVYGITPIDSRTVPINGYSYEYYTTRLVHNNFNLPGLVKYGEFSDFSYHGFYFDGTDLSIIDYKGVLHSVDEDLIMDPFGMNAKIDQVVNLEANIKLAYWNLYRQLKNSDAKFSDLYLYDNFLLRKVGSICNCYPYSINMKYKKLCFESEKVCSSNNRVMYKTSSQYQAISFNNLVGQNSIGDYSLDNSVYPVVLSFRGVTVKLKVDGNK